MFISGQADEPCCQERYHFKAETVGFKQFLSRINELKTVYDYSIFAWPTQKSPTANLSFSVSALPTALTRSQCRIKTSITFKTTMKDSMMHV